MPEEERNSMLAVDAWSREGGEGGEGEDHNVANGTATGGGGWAGPEAAAKRMSRVF